MYVRYISNEARSLSRAVDIYLYLHLSPRVELPVFTSLTHASEHHHPCVGGPSWEHAKFSFWVYWATSYHTYTLDFLGSERD